MKEEAPPKRGFFVCGDQGFAAGMKNGSAVVFMAKLPEEKWHTGMCTMKNPACAGFSDAALMARDQSPSVSSEALPPAAVVFTVTVFSVAKRSR